MNQKPVDDKELEKILDDMFSYIEASTGKDVRAKTMRQLNAHYQKKYIGLATELFERVYEKGWQDAGGEPTQGIKPISQDEAIANIGATDDQ